MRDEFKFEVYSLARANELANRIRDKVMKMTLLQRRITALRLKERILRKFHEKDEFGAWDEIRDEIRHLSRQLENIVEELRRYGLEIKDPYEGVIEFPTIFRNKAGYFVWTVNEPKILFWREAESQEILPIDKEDSKGDE